MIKSFKSKALAMLWESGASRKIEIKLHARILRRLDALDRAGRPEDMNIPGFNFHALRGHRTGGASATRRPVRYTVHVNGPWCITFEIEDGDAYRVDLEQYH